MVLPPPVMRLFSGMPRAKAAFQSLRALRLGAGAQPAAELAGWRALLPAGCAVSHTYASTEALVIAQWWVPRDHAEPEPLLAAGPLQPLHEYAIVDENGRKAPFGEAGELVVRSAYVALGEWRDGGVVPGRMIPVPGRPGWRMFRTGDRVRIAADGMLRVVGRADRQVKINGARVEPAETEAVLRADPRVKDAAVVSRADGERVTLHGFVVAAETPGLISDLRQRLAAALPGQARPSRLTVLERLPMLPNGKIDLVTLSRWAED